MNDRGQEKASRTQTPQPKDPLTWNHAIKGRITGHIIRQDDTWVQIQLIGDHRLRYGAEENRGRIDTNGTILTLRRSRLEVITATPHAHPNGVPDE